MTFVLAFVWSCAFEIPFGKLEKMATAALVKGRLQRPPVTKISNDIYENVHSRESSNDPKSDSTEYTQL